jgi:DNA-binding NarL/FixJ family response regulator
MAIQIVIADDHEVVRVGLRTILQESDIRIVAEAADGVTALKLVKKHKPNVALLDIRMPELDGISCLSRLKLDHQNVAVLMFSAFDSPSYMARSLAMGAAGYLLKTASRKQIVDAIRVAASGESIWLKDDLRRVSGALGTPTSATSDDVHLTKRESEVLKQIVFGLTNKEIAQALGISYETVKEHVQHILQKLAVTDRTQAAVWAVRRNLT